VVKIAPFDVRLTGECSYHSIDPDGFRSFAVRESTTESLGLQDCDGNLGTLSLTCYFSLACKVITHETVNVGDLGVHLEPCSFGVLDHRGLKTLHRAKVGEIHRGPIDACIFRTIC
jgi:hypothetical protein